jgi:predicted ester cyclase
VTTRKTFRGTHRGEFLGIAPTGRSVSFDVIDVVRIADGRIAEHWNVVDLMGLLQQIGPRPRG